MAEARPAGWLLVRFDWLGQHAERQVTTDELERLLRHGGDRHLAVRRRRARRPERPRDG